MDQPSEPVDRPDRLASEADAIERAVTRLLWLERKRFVIHLDRFDVTPTQYLVLVQLARLGQDCTMGRLANQLHQSSATMTGIVDRLVRQALAERCQDPDDRRRVIVRLTERGHRLLGEADSAKRERTVRILATFAAADRARLVALLDAYGERLADRLAEEERERASALQP